MNGNSSEKLVFSEKTDTFPSADSLTNEIVAFGVMRIHKLSSLLYGKVVIAEITEVLVVKN